MLQAVHTRPVPSPAARWDARLRLGFAARSGHSYLADRWHLGPLRVQRTLFPEGPSICHGVIVHPPGGVAGSDSLQIDVDVGADSHAVLTTPGATKWYKSNGQEAHQQIVLRVQRNARLDWLPQNNILFDDAHAVMDFDLIVDADGSALGWEATQLGRHISGEAWRTGDLRTTTTIRRPEGELLWTERAIIDANDPIRLSPQGLGGWTAFGTLWAVGPACATLQDSALHQHLTTLLAYNDEVRGGITCLANGVALIRVVAKRMETLQHVLTECWQLLRPVIHGVPAQPLRLWTT